ncbi:MAG TPA: protein-methionine-sulfoxide reductase heme-binding subunit MsrQ [Pseudomonadales bacterium]
MNPKWHSRTGRWLLWPLGLLPLAWLVWQARFVGLGPDPAEYLSGFSGEWALWFLLAVLTVTPLQRHAGWSWLVPYRQPLGLLAWTYAGLHVLVYCALWLGWDWSALGADLKKRTYIVAGMFAYAMMWPLALTSSRRARQRLGARWKKLHRLVYAIVLAALLHVFWQSKGGVGDAALYALIVIVLLALRWRFRAPSIIETK